MGTKVKETCTVLSQECIGKDIYSMWIQTKTIAGNAKPGQFVSVYTQDGSKLLPRPISLCEIDKEKGALRLVYRVTGRKQVQKAFPDCMQVHSLNFLDLLEMDFHWKRLLAGGYSLWAEESVFRLCWRP